MHEDDAAFNPFMSDPDGRSKEEPGSRSLAFAAAAEHPIGQAQQETQQEAMQIPLPQDQTQLLDGQQQQQGAQSAPQPRRATRLTLRDNLDWKDEIKVCDGLHCC